MKFVLILLPIFFLFVVQVAHAQSLTDSINKRHREHIRLDKSGRQ